MTDALDRLRERKKANHRDVPICMDSALVSRKAELENELSGLKAKLDRSRPPSNADVIETKITELEDDLSTLAEEILQASEWIRVKALGPDEYEALIEAHVPTKDQLREARRLHGARASLQWNTDTFPNALLAESCFVLTVKEYDSDGRPVFEKTEAQFTEEFVKEMRDSKTWSAAEVSALLNLATAINESTSNIGAAGNG